MGIQVSVKCKVSVDGREPKGLREKLWAHLTVWQVNRAVKASLKYKGLTKEQRATQELRERSRFVRGSLIRHYIMVVGSFILIPLCGYEIFPCWENGEFWKATGWALGILVWLYKFRSDYRSLQSRKREERELLVDEVHDL